MATSSLLSYPITLSPPLLIALRIAPLLSTTASMTHAYMEYLATTSFLTAPNTDTRLARAMIAAAPASTDSSSATKESSSRRESPTHTTHPAAAIAPQKNPAENDVTAAENLLIPRWFVSLFSTGLYSVITLNTLTLLSSSLNIFLVPGGTRPLGSYRKFYVAGLVAAGAHYAFVPLVGRSVGALFSMCDEGERQGKGVKWEEEEEEEAKGWVREWVGWHVVRWGTVDLVSWGSFCVGVVGGLGR